MKMSFLGRICIFLCFVLCDNTLFAQVTMNSIALKHNMTVDTVYAFYNIYLERGDSYRFENDIISGHIIFGQLNGEIKWSMYRFTMTKKDIIANAVERVYDREGNSITEGVWERQLIANESQENRIYDTIIDYNFMEQLYRKLEPKDLVIYCEKKELISGKNYLPDKEEGSSIINYGDIYANLKNMIPYNSPLSEECHSDNNILFIKFPKDDQKGYVTGTFSKFDISNNKSIYKSYISFDSTIYIDSILNLEPLEDLNSEEQCGYKSILFRDNKNQKWYATATSGFKITEDKYSLDNKKYISFYNYIVTYNPDEVEINYQIFSRNNPSGINANLGKDITFSDNILILTYAGGQGTRVVEHNYVLNVKNNAKTGKQESRILDLENGKNYEIPKNLVQNQSVIESFSCNDEYTSFLLFTDNKGVIHYYNPDKKKIQKAKIKKCENDY